MKIKLYGKLINTYQKSSNGGALIDRVLEIYETKKGLKGVVWIANKIGWRENRNNILSVAHFSEKDGDASEYRVREYFGFLAQ